MKIIEAKKNTQTEKKILPTSKPLKRSTLTQRKKTGLFRSNPPTHIQLFFKKRKNNKFNTSYINNNNNSNNIINNINIMNSKKSVFESRSKKKLSTDLEKLNTELNQEKEKNNENLNIMDDYEINNLNYLEALKLDKRTCIQIYCTMVRKKHLIMFAFCTPNDYNLAYIKFSKFIFILGTNFASGVLFFFDSIMHKIYINSERFNILSQIPQILYSFLVSVFIEFIINFLILSEEDIHEIKENIKTKKDDEYLPFISAKLDRIKMKFILYFIFSFGLLLFYWYFVATFCAVYENTQIIFIKETFTSFSLNLLYPFFKFIAFTLFRVISLRFGKDNTACKILYKLGVYMKYNISLINAIINI